MLQNGEVYEYLLSDDGMGALRERIILENEWFFHETENINLQSIQNSVLEPRPRTDTIYPPPCKTKSLTATTPILCFCPISSPISWKGVVGNGPTTTLALNKINVPTNIGLDFTFPQHWNTVQQYMSTIKGANQIDAAVHAIYKCGVIVFYTSLQPETLRVQVEDTKNPQEWPLLKDLNLNF